MPDKVRPGRSIELSPEFCDSIPWHVPGARSISGVKVDLFPI